MSLNIVHYFSSDPSNGTLNSVQYGFTGFAFIISVLGTFANFLVFIAILKRADFTPHLMLILSLVFADLLLCSTDTLALLGHMISGTWQASYISPLTYCVTYSSILTCAMFAEVLSFTLIAIERYLVICRGWYKHDTQTKFAIAGIWGLGIICAALYATSYDNIELDSSLLICKPNYAGKLTLTRNLNIITLVAMIFYSNVTASCYYAIYMFYHVRMEKQQRSEVISQSESSSKPIAPKELKPISEKERRLFVKLLTITGIFLLFNAPFIIDAFLQVITGELSPFWFATADLLLITLNFVINPFLLYYLDPLVKSEVNAFVGIYSKPTTPSSAPLTTSEAPALPASPFLNDGVMQLSNMKSNDGKDKDTIMMKSVIIHS